VSDFCVIGSGPAAVSAAVALTRRNLRVTMLDAGREIDPSRQAVVTRMSAQSPQEWSDDDARLIKEGVEASASGIPLKRLYGSGFPFDTSGSGIEITYRNAAVRPGFARGGLSNVWGAGMLPFHRDDLADWPVEAADLERHYPHVLSFLPFSAAHDALENSFPLYKRDVETMPPSAQGKAFLADAARGAPALARGGITVGQSRLAVRGHACRQCGLCLYGCPYGLIWNSASVLDQRESLPDFRYERGFVVDRLQERNGRVEIEGHDLTTGSPRRFDADRVLLGAGAISSTAILLASLGDFAAPVRLADSFYFLLPLLRFAGVPTPEREPLHTLAQAFAVMRDPDVCREFVHFSIYGFNDLMVPSLRASIGALGGSSALASRTLVAGGYLHSRLSPGMLMTVEAGGRVVLEGENSDRAIATAKKAAAKLLRQTCGLRTLPLTFAMRFPPPGRGFHTGGSFPMRAGRTRHTSDIEGRPFGFDRVHLIDAACLPSIPATTITLPVMANAWRIANLAADRA
jgi:choline dehydrogenase-like flavoprotein